MKPPIPMRKGPAVHRALWVGAAAAAASASQVRRRPAAAAAIAALAGLAGAAAFMPVSYTHLTLPTTPYV